MDVVLSIQSHVVFGCVGNKAAVYPLQTMGFDVWPVHTVQFSNHTGYGKWKGEIFSADHIKNVIDGVFDIGQAHQCKAVLSGYMGSAEICAVVSETVKRFKTINKDVLYLCDPVIGNSTCYVSPEVLHFFKNNLEADIITPNTYEAETLSGLSIHSRDDLERVADFFHHKGIKVVVITGIKLQKDFFIFASNGHDRYAVDTKEYNFKEPVNGTGDLFSAVFLGAYLQHQNLLYALEHATFCLNAALELTSLSGNRELQILSVPYGVR